MNSQTHLVDLDGTAPNQGENANDQPSNEDVIESAEGTGSSDHISDEPKTAPDEGNTGDSGSATPSQSG